MSIVNYVLRTSETVLLSDADQSERFRGDPYVSERRPRSLMCMPVLYQGKLTGALYLENSLTRHAFEPGGLAVLQLIASQAATSLENARLYAEARRAKLRMTRRIVMLHYSPVLDTVMGEPEQIFPFLGNDRLVEPIDRFKAAVVFHGHAHHGTFAGKTPGGVPVFNVSMLRVREDARAELFYVHELPIPAGAVHGEREPDVEREVEAVR